MELKEGIDVALEQNTIGYMLREIEDMEDGYNKDCMTVKIEICGIK